MKEKRVKREAYCEAISVSYLPFTSWLSTPSAKTTNSFVEAVKKAREFAPEVLLQMSELTNAYPESHLDVLSSMLAELFVKIANFYMIGDLPSFTELTEFLVDRFTRELDETVTRVLGTNSFPKFSEIETDRLVNLEENDTSTYSEVDVADIATSIATRLLSHYRK